MTLIERIRDLVANGQTEKSLEELLSYVKENNNDVVDQLILLKGRMKTLNNSIIEGTIDDDVAGLERAKINDAILKILNDITPSYLGTEKHTKPVYHTTQQPKNQTAMAIVGGVFILALVFGVWYMLSPKQNGQQQVAPVQESIQIQLPQFEHNLIYHNAYYMKIWLPGRLKGYKGKKGQLVTRFLNNGQFIAASPTEATYRDAYGFVAVGTVTFDITTDDFYLNDLFMYIPYSAFNFPNTNGKVMHTPSLYVEVFINGVSTKVTGYQSFSVKW